MSLWFTPIVVTLLLLVNGCMQRTSPLDSARVEIVSFETIETAKNDATSRLQPGPGGYENWESLHESLKSVLVEYGTVSWDPDPLPDFYFSGDWFHENSDGFGICDSGVISKELLLKLRRVVAARHQDAILIMNGIADPIEGIIIFVTSTSVLIGWQDLTRNSCEKRLRDVGVTLD